MDSFVIVMEVFIIYTGILLYPRFSEYELSVLLSVLKQGQKRTVFIGLNNQVVKGEAGLTSIPEATINEIDINQLDSLVLPGVDDFEHLFNHSELTSFLRNFIKKNIIIGAISSAPYLLSMSGLLSERKYTTGLTANQRDFLGTFNEDNYIDSPVVIDRNLITARGAAFIEFAIQYGELLNLNFDKSWYTIN